MHQVFRRLAKCQTTIFIELIINPDDVCFLRTCSPYPGKNLFQTLRSICGKMPVFQAQAQVDLPKINFRKPPVSLSLPEI